MTGNLSLCLPPEGVREQTVVDLIPNANDDPRYRVFAEDTVLDDLHLTDGLNTTVDTSDSAIHVEAMLIRETTAAEIAEVIVDTLTNWEADEAPHGQILALGEEFNGVSIVDLIQAIRALEGLQYGAPIAFVGDIKELGPEQLREIRKHITHQLGSLTESTLKTLAEAEDKRRALIRQYALGFTEITEKISSEWRKVAEQYDGEDDFVTEIIAEITCALGRLQIYLSSFEGGSYARETQYAIHDLNNLITTLSMNPELLEESGFNPEILGGIRRLTAAITERGQQLQMNASQTAAISQRIFEFQASNLESVEGKNIVIIDDNTTNTRVIAEWAKRNGATSVSLAHTPAEVDQLAQQIQAADIIICDHNLTDKYTGAHVFAKYQDQLKTDYRFVIHTDDQTVINDFESVYSGATERLAIASKFLVGDFQKALA